MNLSDKDFKTGGSFHQLDKEVGNDERVGLPFGIIIEGEIILARNPWVSDFIFIFLFYVLGTFLTFPLSLFLGTDLGDFEMGRMTASVDG